MVILLKLTLSLEPWLAQPHVDYHLDVSPVPDMLMMAERQLTSHGLLVITRIDVRGWVIDEQRVRGVVSDPWQTFEVCECGSRPQEVGHSTFRP